MTRQWYVEIGKTKLIAKPSEGDARDACYQHKLMVGFTNLYRTFVNAGYKFEKNKQTKVGRNSFPWSLSYIKKTWEVCTVISP